MDDQRESLLYKTRYIVLPFGMLVYVWDCIGKRRCTLAVPAIPIDDNKTNLMCFRERVCDTRTLISQLILEGSMNTASRVPQRREWKR